MKRQLPMEPLVNKHGERILVTSGTRSSIPLFGCCVRRSPFFPLAIPIINRQLEISEQGIPVLLNQDVRGFNIPMNNMHRMKIL